MFNAILFPVDLSSEQGQTKAAQVASQLAKDYNATLHVLTVLPNFQNSMVASYFQEGFEERALKDAGEKLEAWAAEHLPNGLDMHLHVDKGRVYDEIIRAADKLGADAIVMASQDPGITEYLLGPNSSRVVRHAKQSVFVVRD